ncbi:MAG: hypothetical protein WCI71_11295 [Bacteroidota bacterium]
MMTIAPLPNSTPIDPKGLFKKGIDEFMEVFNRRPSDEFPGKCELTLYYFNGPSYTKAIWIKVHNIHRVNVWIRVFCNELDKKRVNAYSECKLDCLSWTHVPSYALPPTFNGSGGIWMTDQGNQVRRVSWDIIVNELENYLECLCKGKCIEKLIHLNS